MIGEVFAGILFGIPALWGLAIIGQFLRALFGLYEDDDREGF